EKSNGRYVLGAVDGWACVTFGGAPGMVAAPFFSGVEDAGPAPAGLGSVLIWPGAGSDIFSLGVASFGVTSPSMAVALEFVPAAPSTLPRMTGKPSLPPPIITTFEFRDCASASVASMPRQRR